MSLIKDLVAMYGVNVRYLICDNAGENDAFEQLYNRKGWVKILNISHLVNTAKWES